MYKARHNMDPTIHIIHGIHTSEGSTSTPALMIPKLKRQHYNVVVHDYGWVLGILSRFQNEGRAKKIAPFIKEGDIILAHSNGADITRRMLKSFGIKPAGIILLQPALDDDIEFEPGDYWINVFFNEEDKAVWIAKFLPLHHPYGEMGRVGYTGLDTRVKNYNTLKICSVGGHSLPYQKSPALRQLVVDSIR